MEWLDIIQKRKTNFTWADTPVPREMIEEIIDEVYENIPSKQGHMPYTVDVLDWWDKDLRHFLFKEAHRNGEKTVEQDLGNPQLLAPWVFLINYRKVTPRPEDVAETQYNVTTDKYSSNISYLEAGIVATYIMLACENRGLATGLCQCLRDPHAIAREMGRTDSYTILMLGAGYPKDSVLYFDPRVEKNKPKPVTNYIKPDKDEIWRII